MQNMFKDEREEQAEDRFYFPTERAEINAELGDLESYAARDELNKTQNTRVSKLKEKMADIEMQNIELHECMEACMIDDIPY